MPDIDRFIVANWKMNGSQSLLHRMLPAVEAHLESSPLSSTSVVVCPPYPYLSQACSFANGLMVGAQDCSAHEDGAYTGDVSAQMLKDMGVSHVILGHSERRVGHKETSQLIAQKVEQAHHHDLTTIVCIGETKTEKEHGKTIDVLKTQLDQSLPKSAIVSKTIVAYEPIWAIGTGITPTPEEANQIHQVVHEYLYEKFQTYSAIPILYGGSVKGSNADQFMDQPFVNGVLVGGASLKQQDFIQIIGG